MDRRDERQVNKNRNCMGTESLFNPIHRELSEEPLHILDQLAVWQRTHNTEPNSHRCRCCLEFVIQPPAPKSTRCHRYNLVVTRTSCAYLSEIWSLTDKLYRVSAVTGSNLLSPGPQALVPVVTVANHVR
ncbi:hypothetical protein PIB30_039823 [Stylosanthes scabra]|uniref:Uncharacterized protein n=1 Tax=Stylosanthes scabra TaxID=79078 RepID=A0ABU6REI1_9FABA|nr:hypothetical protein [Stylosanthes scabra]